MFAFQVGAYWRIGVHREDIGPGYYEEVIDPRHGGPRTFKTRVAAIRWIARAQASWE